MKAKDTVVFWNIKPRTLSPMKKNKGRWVLWIMQLDFGNWYIMRNLWTHSLMWNMGFGMHGHANFALEWSECRFCMQQCNAMKNCAMFMTFFPLLVILIFSFFFCFCVKNKDWLSLSKRWDNSCNLILSFANLFWVSLKVYVLI